jgi:hypothetical protein
VFSLVLVRPINDNIQEVRMGYLSKIKGILETPYEQTIFIDTDTFFCDTCDELFRVIYFFIVLIYHDYQETSFAQIDGSDLKGLNTYNTGVIVYNSSDRVMSFLNDWATIFKDGMDDYWSDQPAFMKALLYHPINTYSLQTIYNFRFR